LIGVDAYGDKAATRRLSKYSSVHRISVQQRNNNVGHFQLSCFSATADV
jgi:hypothetical protein